MMRAGCSAAPTPRPPAPRATSAVPRQLPRTVEEIEGEIEAQLDADAASDGDAGCRCYAARRDAGQQGTRERRQAAARLADRGEALTWRRSCTSRR